MAPGSMTSRHPAFARTVRSVAALYDYSSDPANQGLMSYATVASCLLGTVMGLDVFTAHDPARAAALADYYRSARDRDLYRT